MHARNPAAVPTSSAAASQSDVTTATANRPRYLTRRQAVRFINDELSLPLGDSTFTKDCANGRGPIPAKQFGTRHLYTPDELTRWAEARCRPVAAKADSPPTIADDTGTSPKPKRGRPRKVVPKIDGAASSTITATSAAPPSAG
jgi:hypothetical protein